MDVSSSERQNTERISVENHAAFERLDTQYRERIRRFCARRFSGHDAEELTQRTFVRAWEAFETLRNPDLAIVWLYRIAYRIGIDESRRRVPLSLEGLGVGVDGETNGESCCALTPIDSRSEEPSVVAQRNEQARNLWSIAEAVLSPREFSLLWLRYADELTDREISQITNDSPGSIRIALFRIRRKLHPYLADDASPPLL